MITRNSTEEEIIKNAPPCKCVRCEHGCNFGSGCFTDDQLPAVAEFLKISEEKLKEKYLEQITKFNTTLWRPKHKKNKFGFGPCVFFEGGLLKAKGCSIHDVKPKECQVAMGCTDEGEENILWFNMNHFPNENDPESIRQYAVYLKSGGKTLPDCSLEELVPDKEKLKKILGYEILK